MWKFKSALKYQRWVPYIFQSKIYAKLHKKSRAKHQFALDSLVE